MHTGSNYPVFQKKRTGLSPHPVTPQKPENTQDYRGKIRPLLLTLCQEFWTRELVAASTEPLVLSILSKGESYGYALIQEVKGLSQEKIEWTDGMLHPVLHRMEREGWIASRWGEAENGRKRKYYSLKKNGKKALQAQREQWGAVSGVLEQLWKEQYV
jgi:DNA-binding PadR family transcriptional regulator